MAAKAKIRINWSTVATLMVAAIGISVMTWAARKAGLNRFANNLR